MKNTKVNRTTSAGRGVPPVSGGSTGLGADAARLRQQLVHARAEIADLQEELQEKNNLYLNAIKERDGTAEQLTNAKDSLNRFEALVKQQVDRAMEKERKQHNQIKSEKDALEQRLKLVEDEKNALMIKNKELNEKIRRLDDEVKYLSKNADWKDSNNKIERVRADLGKKERELVELMKHVNTLQDQMEDFMAENKVLRDMAGVPANYGIDREKVRLIDREKIDDFKKLIRVLQDDNYRLEEERAKLKHMLKQQSMMFSCKTPDQRYQQFNLTPDQVARVDEFVWRLVNDEASEPADFYRLRKENEKLKAQIEALNDKGYDFVKGQLEVLFKDMAGASGGGLSSEQFQKITADYAELKAKLDNLVLQKPGQAENPVDRNQWGNLAPPVPIWNSDNTITHGFSTKFNTKLPVHRKNAEGTDGKELYDNAFLQLQLQECFELIQRKDDTLKMQKREIDTLYNRIKKYLHMQDHLYKDFVKMENDQAAIVDELKAATRTAEECANLEQIKVKKLEALVLSLEKGGSSEDAKTRLVELTKQNSLLEVNLIRMTRKYQTLEEQEKLLRRNYQNVELEMSEMEVACVQRINQLKEWKRNATFQLKQLYEQLRVAVPLAEHEAISKDLEIYKQKNGDLFARNREYAQKISELQIKSRELSDAVRAPRELQESKGDLERELSIVKARLEALDPKYKWENQMFQQIAQILTSSKVSVTRAFEHLDINRDGRLPRGEFIKALRAMGLEELSGKEIDALLTSIDSDADGHILYKEFSKKLQRCGLKNLTAEERLVLTIIRTLKSLRMSKSDLFTFINKDGGGFVTRNDFRDILGTLEMKGVTKEDIEKFIDYFYKDETGGIDLKSFQRIFEKWERQVETEDTQKAGHKDRTLKQEFIGGSGLMHGASNHDLDKGFASGGTGMNHIKELEYQRKIASLEDKVKQVRLELENEGALRNLNEESSKLLQKHHDDLRNQFALAREEHFTLVKSLKEHEQTIRQSIRKEDAEKIQRSNQQLQMELTETRAALLSYKNMHNVVCEQVKSLKVMHERRKDENESLLSTLRDIQAESFDQQKLGKLYYVVMLSRWQEAAVNKKYDVKINECKELAGELLNVNQLLVGKEKDHHNAEHEVRKTKQVVLNLKQELQSCKNMFLTIQQGAEFNRVIDELTDERGRLEETYFKLRSELVAALDMGDSARIKAEEKEQLVQDLRMSKTSELSDKLIQLSETLQQQRLAAMKAERNASELRERENYLAKLLSDRTAEVAVLEQSVAKLEKDLNVKEEKWRLQDNERMKQYFNWKLDQNAQKADPNGLPFSLQNQRGPTTIQSTRPHTSAAQLAGRDEKLPREAHSEDQTGKMASEIAKLTEEVMQKDAVIRKLRSWHDTDAYVMGGEEGMKDVMEEQRIKFQAVHDQENKEMADAAYQTIKTLNEMLEQKKIQLRSKEDQIDKLRQQMADQRELHAEKYMRLQNDFTAVGVSSIANLHKSINGQDEAARGLGRHSETELQKTLVELEHLKTLLRDQQVTLEELRLQSQSDQRARREAQQEKQALDDHYTEIVNNLQKTNAEKVKIEREKREKIAKARFEKNEKLIEKFHLQMVEYQQEIQNLKDQNEVGRLKQVVEQSKSPIVNEALLMGGYGTDKQVSDLQNMVKARDQDILKLREKEIKHKQEKEAANGKLDEAAKKLEAEKVKVTKYMKEKEEALHQLRSSRELAEKERVQKERYKDDWNKLMAERQGTGVNGGLSYSEMEKKLKELENDVYVLEAQRTTVLAHNPRTATFEYIGAPMQLNQGAELKSVEEIIQAMKSWLQRPSNDRLSIRQVFESLDVECYGELSVEKFESALARLGIRARPSELQILREALDPKKINFMGYRCLVRELQGVTQLEFLNKGIIKMAKLAESRDLSSAAFRSLIDPGDTAVMTLAEFKTNMAQCEAADFRFSEHECIDVFKNVTRSENRLDGVTMKIQTLAEKVFHGVRAIVIDQVRTCLERAPMSVSQLFAKYDKNKDSFLEHGELAQALSDCHLLLGKNMQGVLFEVLDPRAGKKQVSTGKISFGVLKFFLESFGPNAVDSSGGYGSKALNQISSGKVDNEQHNEDHLANTGFTHEMIQVSKRASRKILSQCHNTIVELIGKLDRLEEGILNKEELKQALVEQKINELDAEELNTLLKYCDKGLKGYVSANRFIDKLYALAGESEADVILRRLSKALSHSDTNLRQEMQRQDTTGNGKLDKTAFKKCLKQLNLALTDSEIQTIIQELGLSAGPSASSSKKEAAELIDIKKFSAQVAEAGKAKPLPNFVLQGPKGSSKLAQSKGSANPMGTFEAEKKYKKNLEALKTEIEEKNREIQGLRKEMKDGHDRYNRLDAEKKQLEARLVDRHSKPPKETHNESLAHSQAQELMQLRDQLFYQQQENSKLRKTIEVSFKAEISRLSTEKEQVEEKLRDSNDERSRLQAQIGRLLGKPMDGLERREEQELNRQMRIEELEEGLDASEKSKAEIQDQLFKAQEKVLDLQFEIETYDLEYARLQRRIKELDQFRQTSAQLSAGLRAQSEKERLEIEEAAGRSGEDSKKKKQESVRLRTAGSKSVAELEMLVESLKRVIEKLRTECEALKAENAKSAGQTGKVASEKALRQKISNLEQLVHSHEMKEVNLDVRERTIKKLIEANKQLREDLVREADRYMLLESRYRDVLVRYGIAAKDVQRNEELVFGLTTGVSMDKYSNFLTDQKEY